MPLLLAVALAATGLDAASSPPVEPSRRRAIPLVMNLSLGAGSAFGMLGLSAEYRVRREPSSFSLEAGAGLTTGGVELGLLGHLLSGSPANALDVSLGASVVLPHGRLFLPFVDSYLRHPLWIQAGVGYVHRRADGLQFRVAVGVFTLGMSALEECPADPTTHDLETCGQYAQAFSGYLPWLQLALGWGSRDV